MYREGRFAAFAAAFVLILGVALSDDNTSRSFTIANDRFVKDGTPIQIISGSIHYFRTHPYYWEDRLLKMKAMGLNTVELYIAWNFHEHNPGKYKWDGPQDVERFIRLADKLGFIVILRPGPYICAEWDFGGFPAWLGSSSVSGGGTMKLRSSDPLYLAHVDRWWNALLPRMTPLLYVNGGPIVMVQIENEFGFVGKDSGADETYIRHLLNTAKNALGSDVIFFTTDPPDNAYYGTLRGGEVYTAVDFGTWFSPAQVPDQFNKQKQLNADGQSPAFVSEFYPGWLTHFGEQIQNPNFNDVLNDMKTILAYNNNSGSVNLYMALGGTNIGWSIGGQEDCAKDSDGSTCLDTVAWNEGDLEPYKSYVSVITSYDYDAPISEAGDYGQPGTGPPPDGAPANKYEAIRSLIQNHTGRTLPPVPPRPRILAYGEVVLRQQGTLLSQLDTLAGPGIYSETPKTMEEYNQWNGMILYRTNVSASDLRAGAKLYVGSRVRDSAVILAAGTYVGSLERNGKLFVVLNDAADKVARANADQDVLLDILVMQIGRSNFGRNFDLKGLVSDVVLLNGKPLKGWLVFPLPLDSLDSLQLPDVSNSAAAAASAAQGSVVHVEESIAHSPHVASTRPPTTPLAQAPKPAVTPTPTNTARHTQVVKSSNAPAHAPSPADHAKQVGPPAHAPGPARAEIAAHAPALAPTHRAKVKPPAPGIGPLANHTGVANHPGVSNHIAVANHTGVANLTGAENHTGAAYHTGAANHIGVAKVTGGANHTGANPKLKRAASPLLRSHSSAAAKVSLAALDSSHDTSRAKLMKEMEEVARSEAFPAISAFVASNGGQACPAAPKGNGVPSAVPSPAFVGPTFYRGYFSINASLANANGVFPDTYLNIGLSNWAKGVAFINGFNLGYYWPAFGPANTMYIPGPLLRACNNELVLLEVGNSMVADCAPTVVLTDQPDFHGPRTNGTSHAATSFQAWTAGSHVDPSYYWRTGVEGGHLIPTSNRG